MRENEYIINTIQEITLQAYTMGIYDYLFNERNMSRTDIFQLFVEWAKDFEKTHENFDWMLGSHESQRQGQGGFPLRHRSQ